MHTTFAAHDQVAFALQVAVSLIAVVGPLVVAARWITSQIARGRQEDIQAYLVETAQDERLDRMEGEFRTLSTALQSHMTSEDVVSARIETAMARVAVTLSAIETRLEKLEGGSQSVF